MNSAPVVKPLLRSIGADEVGVAELTTEAIDHDDVVPAQGFRVGGFRHVERVTAPVDHRNALDHFELVRLE